MSALFYKILYNFSFCNIKIFRDFSKLRLVVKSKIALLIFTYIYRICEKMNAIETGIITRLAYFANDGL